MTEKTYVFIFNIITSDNTDNRSEFFKAENVDQAMDKFLDLVQGKTYELFSIFSE
jgi:hypothetical protein